MPHGIAAPRVVLNFRGYYGHLVALLDHAVTAGFPRPQHRAVLSVDGEWHDNLLMDLLAEEV